VEITDWPLILAGPIVRRVEPKLASVWVALKEPATIRLDVWEGIEPANTTRLPFAQATTFTLRVGENLHVGLPYITLGEQSPAFLPGQIYSYNLTITPNGESPQTLASLGLLTTVTGVEHDDKVLLKPHLALGYANGMLPSFALPPAHLTDLKLLHGSCRRPHANTPDAMTFIDDVIEETRADGLRRPHQLFLTGDQIYADDVAAALLHMLTPVANQLTGETEQLPTRWPLQPSEPGVRLWPADSKHFPTGLRKNVVTKDARFTTEDFESHLLSLGEFCAMYLFVWSNALWPDTLPRIEDVFTVPTHLGQDMDIWRLHADIPTLDAAKIKIFVETNCAKQGDSFRAHRATIKKVRDGLPKVRRALANVATYMIFDDHEITDDWYLSPIWRDRVLGSALGRTVVRNGLIAYAVFQGWGNDPKRFDETVPLPTPTPSPQLDLLAKTQMLFPTGETMPPVDTIATQIDLLLGLDGKDPPLKWHYSVPGPKHQVQVLDCRTRRTFASRVSGPGNVSPQALAEQLPAGPLSSGLEVLVLVSSLTVLGTPVIDELLGPMLFRLFDLGHKNEATMPGLNPDAIEAWPYDPNVFESLLKRLEPYRKVVLLSGDVHFATSAGMSYWKNGAASPARFAQFIASGLQNLFREEVRMAGQYMKFMQTVIEGKIGIERLGWNTNGANLIQIPEGELARPALRDRLRKTPVLLPTEGWPDGTTENPQRPPDWTWRMDVVRDERPESERPTSVRPVDLVPGNPTADVATDLNGYRKAIVRSVKHMDKEKDNLAHARQILFASNLGQVHFERRAAPDDRLHAVHSLYAIAAHDSAATSPSVVMRHEVALDVNDGSPIEHRQRPTFV
jgi:hypothetical protein